MAATTVGPVQGGAQGAGGGEEATGDLRPHHGGGAEERPREETFPMGARMVCHGPLTGALLG